jgi:hypothetical protein
MAMSNPTMKHHIELFSGAMWSQRHQWRGAARSLPAKTCLLVIPEATPKQNRLRRTVAFLLEQKGWQVYTWKPATHSEALKESQRSAQCFERLL